MTVVYDKIIDKLVTNKIDIVEISPNITIPKYLSQCLSNILSDTLITIQKSKRTMYTDCVVEQNSIIKCDDPMESITNNVLLINNGYYIVKKFIKYEDFGYCKFQVYPDISHNLVGQSVNVNVVANIGDKMQQCASVCLMSKNISTYEPILAPIADQSIYIDGAYKYDDVKNMDHCNEYQLRAIKTLHNNVEIIQGPPGTGKTTTIVNIIRGKIPNNHKILCTAVQNQAIESLVIKILEDDELKKSFVVVGDKHRLKHHSSQYTLDSIYLNNDIIRYATKKIKEYEQILELIQTNNYKQEYYDLSNRKQTEYVNSKKEKIQEYETGIMIEKASILSKIRLIISTIGSSHGIYNIISGNIETIILDEAGATTEMQLMPLIRLKPTNLILVGDHKQLAGFTCATTNIYYNKSTMEKMINGDRKYYLLKKQYRMPDDICKLVSKLFYNNMLVSDKSCESKSNKNIQWIHAIGECQQNGTSFYNVLEAEKIVQLCELNKNKQILVLTFYNEQLHILNAKLKNIKNIICRSVDSCQGMESDIVIVSLVKSHNLSNFVIDKRKICVLLSRAKNKLIIVGNLHIYSNNEIWKCVIDSSIK